VTRNRRNLLVGAVLLALCAVGAAVAVGLALGGDEHHKPRYPGRIAVRDGCGLVHFFQDGSDQRTLCLSDVSDEVSLSWNGRKLAWDTRTPGIRTADAEGRNVIDVSVPPGANHGPSLSPDGERVAFLHSARDDGRLDIWVGDVDANNAEQVTATRNVTDVVWSPKGDWLAYVQNRSDETLEGQISLVRPNGDDAHSLVAGDDPEWAPDGKQLVYVHNRGIWTVDSNGKNAKLIIPNGHSPAWSRDGEQIAFMRAERCAKPPCEEHVLLAFTEGQDVRQIGPAFARERTVLWLRDPFE
jgi:Tol biopolymer transport system component